MPSQTLELSLTDAERFGVAQGDQVNVRSNGHSVAAKVAIRERIRPGSGFLIEGLAEQGPNALAGAEIVEVEKASAGEERDRDLALAEVGFAEATWVLLVKSVIIFALVFAIVPVLTVVERKILGRFQARYGPNRVGPMGLAQPLADALKLVGKEAYKPDNATGFLWAIAPAIVVFTGVATLAILPWGNTQEIGNGEVGLYGIDVSIGVLYFFAFGSIAFYGLLLGGWASGSKYSFLGAMRSAAQLISYEISMGLALLGGVMMAGLALPDRDRRGAGRHLVHRAPVRRLPDLHGRRLRRDLARPVRPARGRRRARRRLPDRVRRDALGHVHDGRVHRDVRRLRHRRDLLPRRLDGPRPRLPRPDLDAR